MVGGVLRAVLEGNWCKYVALTIVDLGSAWSFESSHFEY